MQSWAAYEAAVIDLVKKEMNNAAIPGASVCAVRDSKIIFLHGFGTRDRATSTS